MIISMRNIETESDIVDLKKKNHLIDRFDEKEAMIETVDNL